MMAEGPGLQTAAVPVRLTAQSKQLAYDPIERPKAADGDDAKTIRRRLAPSTVPDDEYDFDEDNDKEIEDEDEEDSDDSDFEDMGWEMKASTLQSDLTEQIRVLEGDKSIKLCNMAD